MTTKHGQDAIRARELSKAKFKSRLKVVAVIVVVAIIWAVFEYRVFT